MAKDYGYGSIYQRASDGLWAASIELPREQGQARRRKVFTAARREAVEAKLAAWRDANPAPEFHGRDMDAARAKGTHTTREWWALVRSVKCRCLYCGADAFLTLQKDHKVPISRGGSDAIDNIAVSCRSCNTEKGRMTADEYAAWKAARS